MYNIYACDNALTRMLVQTGTLMSRTYDASSFDNFDNLEINVDSCEINFVRNLNPAHK